MGSHWHRVGLGCMLSLALLFLGITLMILKNVVLTVYNGWDTWGIYIMGALAVFVTIYALGIIGEMYEDTIDRWIDTYTPIDPYKNEHNQY